MMQFLKLLKDISKPTSKQRREELWDIEGILHNQKFKFDTRPLKNNIKGGSFKTKADKVVYDMKDQYIIVDVEELHQYLKDKKLKKVVLEELISKLDWNIILPKN
tara:strand:+ start:80 stop:394 length:315 start_codon:yes stop_codon:yes gene_type:complete